MLAASDGGFRMTSAAASCPSATRALSTERARRTRFAACSACAGCELAPGLLAPIDASRFVVRNPRPEPLHLGATGHYGLSAARAALHGVPGPAPLREEREPGRVGLEGWPGVRLREQQIWSHKNPRVDFPWHRPRGQNQGASLVHTQDHMTPAHTTVPTHPRSGSQIVRYFLLSSVKALQTDPCLPPPMRGRYLMQLAEKFALSGR